MKTCFDGIGMKHVSFQAGENLAGGQLCKLSANGVAAAAANGDKFIGLAAHIQGKVASVQTEGYCKLRYTGSTAPTLGWCKLSAGGADCVKSDTSGREYLVCEVNTADKWVGLFL